MHPAPVALLVVGGLAALSRWGAAGHIRQVLHPRWRLDPADPSVTAALSVSVCVPARNEAAVIDRLLDSLDAQDHARTEVIVCDDRSTDDTAARARGHRCTVVSGSEPPADWIGKQWALRNAVAAATGDVLCFVDADTWHHPAALRTSLALMERENADVLVVVSGHALGSWSERLVLPFLWSALLSFLDVPNAENPARPQDAMGNGQFWLVRRAAYDRIGGHERVRNRLVEDVAIVRELKGAGASLRLRFGPELTRTRMYTGFGALWAGLEKNAAITDPARPVLSATLSILALLLTVFAELWPLVVAGGALALGGAWTHPAVLALAVAQLFFILLGRARVFAALCDGASGTRLSRNPAVLLAQPLGTLLGMVIMVNSLQAQLRGTTGWKGRRVRGRSL
jgi:chlorobactene glucosyltransferase